MSMADSHVLLESCCGWSGLDFRRPWIWRVGKGVEISTVSSEICWEDRKSYCSVDCFMLNPKKIINDQYIIMFSTPENNYSLEINFRDYRCSDCLVVKYTIEFENILFWIFPARLTNYAEIIKTSIMLWKSCRIWIIIVELKNNFLCWIIETILYWTTILLSVSGYEFPWTI